MMRRKLIVIPTDVDPDLLLIAREVQRIHEAAEFSAQTQFEQAKIWRSFNYWLGAPAAVAAALAGSTLLSSGSWSIAGVPGSVIGGVLALVAAALTAILTTVNASRRMTQSQTSGNAFLELQTQARQLITIDLRKFLYDEAREALDRITSTRDELNKTADPPSGRAYRRASKNIYEVGGQDYAADEEADHGTDNT